PTTKKPTQNLAMWGRPPACSGLSGRLHSAALEAACDAAAGRGPAPVNSSVGERIPNPNAKLVVVGSSRIALVDQVHTSQRVDRKQQRSRQLLKPKLEPRSCFREVGPILALRVRSDVEVPKELSMKSLDPFCAVQRVTGASLRVKNGIVPEPAHEDS